MDVKWILAIGLEAGFWLMLVSFLVLRYRFGVESVTRWFVIGAIVDTLGLIALGLWDYARTGEVSGYTSFIVVLLIYAVFWGKKDLARLDGWMERRFGDGGKRRGPTSA